MAPECVFDRKYSLASDVWSFAVFCFEVFTMGGTPYKEMSPEGTVLAVQRGYRLPCPPMCPENVYVLMLQCWQVDPHARPAFAAIHAALRAVEDADAEEAGVAL